MKSLFLSIALFASVVLATDHFDSDVTIIGTVKAVNESEGYALQVGVNDAFNRASFWFYGSNDADPDNSGGTYVGDGGVMHLGACQADGFPLNRISEGITVWGQNENGGEMNSANWSLARIKPNRFQLRQSVSGVQEDIIRVDPSKLQWRNKILVKEDNTTVSNLLVAEGDGSHIFDVPQDDTTIHLTDNSLGRIPIKVNGVTRYIPYFS